MIIFGRLFIKDIFRMSDFSVISLILPLYEEQYTFEEEIIIVSQYLMAMFTFVCFNIGWHIQKSGVVLTIIYCQHV